MRIIVIRHGESEGDILNVHEGRADFNLTEKGHIQGYRQDFCANLIPDKPPGYQIPGQTVAVKVAVHLS